MTHLTYLSIGVYFGIFLGVFLAVSAGWNFRF